jgi:hypothetical protein
MPDRVADDLGWKAVTGVSVRSEHSHTGPIPPAAARHGNPALAKLTVPLPGRVETARRRSQPAQTTPEVRPKGRKHDETGDRIALTPVPPAFYPAYLPANRRLTSLQPEIPQQPPRTVPKSNYLRVQPVEVDIPAALADGTSGPTETLGTRHQP